MDAGHNRRNKAAFLNFFGEAWKLGQITRPKRSRGRQKCTCGTPPIMLRPGDLFFLYLA